MKERMGSLLTYSMQEMWEKNCYEKLANEKENNWVANEGRSYEIK